MWNAELMILTTIIVIITQAQKCFGKIWEDRIVKKSDWNKDIGLMMLITIICLSLLLPRSILFYIVTEHYYPNAQCRIGLISNVIVIDIVVISIINPMPLFQSLFFTILSSHFFPKTFLHLFPLLFSPCRSALLALLSLSTVIAIEIFTPQMADIISDKHDRTGICHIGCW